MRSIPSVAYTDPEVAWIGLTETEAKAEGARSRPRCSRGPRPAARCRWAARDGLTKLLLDPETRRVLGAGIVGVNAGELLAEVGAGDRGGADVEDVALTIHAHPTLSETVGFAAEMAEGTITDLMPKRKRAKA